MVLTRGGGGPQEVFIGLNYGREMRLNKKQKSHVLFTFTYELNLEFLLI